MLRACHYMGISRQAHYQWQYRRTQEEAKCELLQQPEDIHQARRMVSQSIGIYNQERPHFSLQLKTPDEVHRASLQVSY